MAGREAAVHFSVVAVGRRKMSRKTVSPGNTLGWIGIDARLVSVKLRAFAHARKREDRRNEKLREGREKMGKKRTRKKEGKGKWRGRGGGRNVRRIMRFRCREGGRNRRGEVCAASHEKVRPISSLILRSSRSRAPFPTLSPPFFISLRLRFAGERIKVRPRLSRLSVFSKLNLIDSSNRVTFIKSADSGLIVTIISDECVWLIV